MKNRFLASFTLLFVLAISYGQTPGIVTEPTDPCGWTYSQGFRIGKGIALEETYYRQNFNVYNQTRIQFGQSGCYLYVAGVVEGYMRYRFLEAADPCLNDPQSCSGGPEGFGDFDWPDIPDWTETDGEG